MTKIVAKLALMMISIGLMLGNWWFTFGLWPRSWGAFAFFATALVIVTALQLAIEKGD